MCSIYPISQKFPQRHLWNSSSVYLTDDGPLLSFHRKSLSASSFNTCLLQMVDGARSLALCTQGHFSSSSTLQILVSQAPQHFRSYNFFVITLIVKLTVIVLWLSLLIKLINVKITKYHLAVKRHKIKHWLTDWLIDWFQIFQDGNWLIDWLVSDLSRWKPLVMPVASLQPSNVAWQDFDLTQSTHKKYI